MQGKVWGETTAIINGSTMSVHFIRVLAGGFCSRHSHRSRANLFFVISGELLVRVERTAGVIDETRLRAGDTTVVMPGLVHQFEAVNDVEAIEVYFIQPIDEEDIVRLSSGGRKPLAQRNAERKKGD